MLLRDYITEKCNGYIDMDVTDVDIDLLVAMVYELGDTSDYYDKFLDWLVNHVQVSKEDSDPLICNFSGAFKPFNDKLKEFFDMDNSEFDEDEAYYEAVVNLEPLISGNASDGLYKKLLDCLH